MELKLDTLGKRVQFCQGRVGGPSKLQKLTGISPSQLNRLIKDNVDNPGVNSLISIADVSGVSLIWLITGNDVEVKTDESYVSIAFYDEESKPPVLFDKTHLEQVLNVNPDHCSFVTMKGDSMSPTINSGDQLLIDHQSVTGDGVFLMKIEGELLVKRLQVIPGMGIDIISDNKKYKSYQLDASKIEVIGRKVWAGGRG